MIFEYRVSDSGARRHLTLAMNKLTPDKAAERVARTLSKRMPPCTNVDEAAMERQLVRVVRKLQGRLLQIERRKEARAQRSPLRSPTFQQQLPPPHSSSDSSKQVRLFGLVGLCLPRCRRTWRQRFFVRLTSSRALICTFPLSIFLVYGFKLRLRAWR